MPFILLWALLVAGSDGVHDELRDRALGGDEVINGLQGEESKTAEAVRTPIQEESVEILGSKGDFQEEDASDGGVALLEASEGGVEGKSHANEHMPTGPSNYLGWNGWLANDICAQVINSVFDREPCRAAFFLHRDGGFFQCYTTYLGGCEENIVDSQNLSAQGAVPAFIQEYEKIDCTEETLVLKYNLRSQKLQIPLGLLAKGCAGSTDEQGKRYLVIGGKATGFSYLKDGNATLKGPEGAGFERQLMSPTAIAKRPPRDAQDQLIITVRRDDLLKGSQGLEHQVPLKTGHQDGARHGPSTYPLTGWSVELGGVLAVRVDVVLDDPDKEDGTFDIVLSKPNRYKVPKHPLYYSLSIGGSSNSDIPVYFFDVLDSLPSLQNGAYQPLKAGSKFAFSGTFEGGDWFDHGAHKDERCDLSPIKYDYNEVKDKKRPACKDYSFPCMFGVKYDEDTGHFDAPEGSWFDNGVWKCIGQNSNKDGIEFFMMGWYTFKLELLDASGTLIWSHGFEKYKEDR